MLDKINNPQELKKLSFQELEQLAEEVRQRIIAVTAKNGGHVAPSLGATDIAIALLKVFDPLKDRIVWDVGHQSYAYKILTERNDRFHTLRQYGGISGFNNVFESKYDAFSVGHSSTSISAALGITVANDLKKKAGRAVAIIGDGALTAGMSFEALNHAGELQKDMIVILNDNNMSISKSVGGLQAYLADILVSRSYNAIKQKVWDVMDRFPARIRRRLIVSAQKFEENIINTFVPNIIFEDLGFKYVGPVDGHDIPKLVNILDKAAKNMVGPVLIHAVTQKGRGYNFAEKDACRFHGPGPYEINTGKCAQSDSLTYSAVCGDTLCTIAEKDKNMVAITAAMADGTGLLNFSQKYPEQFYDVGIAEQHAVTFACGLATQGIKPFVVIYSTFMQRSFDQIIHDAALQKLPIVLCLDRAGLVGEDGATHHGAFDLSYLSMIPGMVVLASSNAQEFIQMLKFAHTYNEGPIAIRYPRGAALFCNKELAPIELGKAVVEKAGEKIALIGIGDAFNDASAVYDMIRADFPEVNPYLIDARFAKPLDTELLDKIQPKVDTIFTFENNSLIGGFGSRIKDHYGADDIKIYSFGLPDKFVPHGPTNILREKYDLTPEKIYPKIKKILAKR